MVAPVNATNDPNGPVALVVPANLKTLIRMVMRAFYGFELFLCMEMLMVYPCIREEDLSDLLRMDLKHVHQHLVNLKREKFINERSIMETSPDGRQAKHSYFFINYKMMVNVIKYKLDKIRIQIESEEKQCTSRANFKCTSCSKTYSDLDTKDIFLTMTCLFCGAEVEEDISCLPNRSSRNLLAKFNTQMEIVFELLSRVEHIRLADDILRPEPVDMTHIIERMMNTPNSQNAPVANPNAGKMGKSAMLKFDAMGMTKWSGDKTRNTDLLGQTRISINFDTTDGTQNGTARVKKELPSILLDHATTDDDWDHYNRDSQILNSLKLAADETMNTNSNTTSTSTNANQAVVASKVKAEESIGTNGSMGAPQSGVVVKQSGVCLEAMIMQKLLIHEKKGEGGEAGSPVAGKKREYEEVSRVTKVANEQSNLGYNNNNSVKKRKLNNGEVVTDFSINKHNGFHISSNNTTNHHSPNNTNHYHHSKSYSDGSDRDDQEDDSSSQSYYHEEDNMDDMSVPKITVQNKLYRLDKLKPHLINMMDEAEKEFYINVCRQLYTEIYEI